MEAFRSVYLIVSVIAGWKFLSYLQAQSGIGFIATVSDYIFVKLLLSVFVEMFAAPIYVIRFILGLFLGKK